MQARVLEREIAATGLVAADREVVFAFLLELENHWLVAGRWIEVVTLAPGPAGARGGRVRIRGPLGLRRTASTRVEQVQAPERLQGAAVLGRTRAVVCWTLAERGPGLTEVHLSAVVVSAGALDRALLALGGAAWMRRAFAGALRRLAGRLDGARAPGRAALSSARA